ncbi:MAG TPA: sensor histidine kinase [Glaciihabitans sp.]|jgi:signal transduction histidine kinase|nr:sensor histidine kinase [Glaciihabitans sp.]
MTTQRWWDIAVLAVSALLLILAATDDISASSRIGAMVCAVAFAATWLLLRGRAQSSPRASALMLVLLLVVCGVGTAFYPSFAFTQCVAFPIFWTTIAYTWPKWSTRVTAVVATFPLAIAIGIGFLVANGTSTPELVSTSLTVGITLVFSLALGLWFSSVYDLVAERDLLIEKLNTAQEQVAALSRDAGVLDERERLAREIHDTIAQDLTGLVLTAQRGRRELRSGNAPGAAAQLSILEDNARSALLETRALVASGVPVGIEGGLTTALNRLGERFERETGITVTVRAPRTAELDRDSEVVLLRCAQEALANVRKHSTATAASVTVSTTHGSVVLRVADNGRGFDPASAPHGFGLAGMRDRLALAGGSLSILSTPDKGTALIASLPGLSTLAPL